MHKNQDLAKTQWYTKCDDGLNDSSMIINNSLGDDETDFQFFINRSKNSIVTLRSKIKKTEEALHEANKNKEENVLTYLKESDLLKNAKSISDKQLLSKQKTDFEKRHLKLDHLREHLQSKLDNYHIRLKEALLAISNESKSSSYKHVKFPMKDAIRNAVQLPISFEPVNKNIGINRLLTYASADNIVELSSRVSNPEFLHKSYNPQRNQDNKLKSRTLPLTFFCNSDMDMSPIKDKDILLNSKFNDDFVSPKLNTKYMTESNKISAWLRDRSEMYAHILISFETLKKAAQNLHLNINSNLREMNDKCNAIDSYLLNLRKEHEKFITDIKNKITYLEIKISQQNKCNSIQKKLNDYIEKLDKLDQQRAQSLLLIDSADHSTSHTQIFLIKLINFFLSVIALFVLVIESFVTMITPITNDARIFVSILLFMISICIAYNWNFVWQMV